MSGDPIRAALERLVELDDGCTADHWHAAITAARAALDAATEGEGPSESDVANLFYRHMGEGSEVGFENAIAEALACWGRPAAPLEGEVGELVAALEADAECAEVEHYDLCNMTADQMRRAADLLQQLSVAAPAVVPEGEGLASDQGYESGTMFTGHPLRPATPPAAPEGEPSDDQWDALVERAWDKYETVGYQGERFMYSGDFGSALDLVRKELARWGRPAAPPAPLEGEVGELVEYLKWLRSNLLEDEELPVRGWGLDNLTRAATLLSQLSAATPAVVPVAERLPGPGDCDAEGRCWLLSKVESEWRLLNVANSGVPHLKYCFSHWLPAQALPLPAPQGGEVGK